MAVCLQHGCERGLQFALGSASTADDGSMQMPQYQSSSHISQWMRIRIVVQSQLARQVMTNMHVRGCEILMWQCSLLSSFANTTVTYSLALHS